MYEDVAKQFDPRINLNVFPPIQQFSIMQEFKIPYYMNLHHQFMFPTKSNQMCLPFPLHVPNPLYHSPGFVPTINPFCFFDDKQHNLRLQQLQRAFQLGVQREQISSSHEPSDSRKDTIDVGCEVKSRRPKDIHIVKHVSGDSKKLISHWDPWFHRRARKQIKIEKEAQNKSSKKSSLVKIRKTRKEKIINSNKCVRLCSKTQNTQHVNPSTHATQSIIENCEEHIEPKIDLLVAPNGFQQTHQMDLIKTHNQKDIEIKSL